MPSAKHRSSPFALLPCMRLLFSTLFFLSLTTPLDAQSARVTTSPSRPVRGRLLTVTVRLARLERAEGTLAGEPLHFTQAASGRLTAIAAVPIDAPDTLPLTVVATSDTVVLPLVVVPGNYRTE